MGNTPKELLENYSLWLRTERGNSTGTILLMKKETENFLRWLHKNGLSLNKINQEIVDEYLNDCYNRYSQNTMKPLTSNLRKFLMHYLKMDIKVRVARRGAPKRDKTPLTTEEIQSLFNSTENALEEAILKTFYYGGIRKQELINLDISDVDFDRYKLQIRHGKRDKERIIDITEDCVEAIKRWLEVRPKPTVGHEDALFLSRYRRRIHEQTVYNIVKQTSARAGIQRNVYPHKFRITNITKMAEEDMSLVDIQIQSGIEDIKTLFGYIQRAENSRKEAYNKAFDIQEKSSLEPLSANMDVAHYRQLATQKYLTGEIDSKTLGSLLDTIDSQDEKKLPQKHNPAYS